MLPRLTCFWISALIFLASRFCLAAASRMIAAAAALFLASRWNVRFWAASAAAVRRSSFLSLARASLSSSSCSSSSRF